MHMAALGAEAGSQEQQDKILKKVQIPDIQKALQRLWDRGIQSGCSWIIGYPGETKESMIATIERAAEMKHKFPRSASDIFPFRAIPGTDDFESAVKLGYEAPETFEEWGSSLDYKFSVDDNHLPLDVFLLWKRYGVTSTFYDGLVDQGSGFLRETMKRISGWRLKHGNYRFPVEQKLWHWYVKLTGQTSEKALEKDMTSGVTPHAPA